MIHVVNKLMGHKKGSKEELSETDRIAISRELIDTYSGNGGKYLESLIKKSFDGEIIKKHVLKLHMCYPILKRLINKISKVYKTAPVRRFYLEGKEIVPIADSLSDMQVIIDPKLYDILHKELYSKTNQIKIKESERKANLLNTAIYKVNYSDNKISLDFIPNDEVSISTKADDKTIADKIEFMNNSGETETWSRDSRLAKNGRYTTSTENNKGKSHVNSGMETIGTAFAPFVVMRDSIPDLDFWNLSNRDVVDVIKQINLTITELRYLVRYCSYGLKYSVNVDMPENATMDPMGFWALESSSPEIGSSITHEVGELNNRGDLQGVKDSVIFLISQLLYNYGLSSQDLVTSAQKSSAESKELDRADFREFIAEQQLIWRLNEESLFEVMRIVYNSEKSNVIPSNIEMVVDFPEVDVKDLESEMKRWVVEIENNVSTAIDWIMDNNKDLTRQQAVQIHGENTQINESNSLLPDDIDLVG